VSDSAPFRAGFISFVGRPNVGKSTLMNALVGHKLAITSSKPQTTRKAIRGIVHRDEGQIVIVDTPGVHRPRTLLGQRLNDVVSATLGDVDVIAMCIPANEKVGPGDRYIASRINDFPRAIKIALVTKTDISSATTILERLMEVQELGEWESIIPVSGLEGTQLDTLVAEILLRLPESEALYPADELTEETMEGRIGELIREATLEGVMDELPHSIAVTIDEMVERDDGLLHIFANLWVERDSQKGIMIGNKGGKLKEIGTEARAGIEALLGRRVYLAIHVKVSKEWQRNAKKLDRLGL
jgi:GTP-binding protein Era